MMLRSPSTQLIRYISSVCNRTVTTTSASHIDRSAETSMNAWITSEFGGQMQYTQVQIPEIVGTTEMLLKVKAASVNPIDTVIQQGYGKEVLSLCKQLNNRSLSPMSILPYIGGRDCSAVVEYVGQGVSKFRRGDEVMAVIDPSRAGSHAEYVIAKESWCTVKPKNVSHVQAAALPYVACTAWSALHCIGRLNARNAYMQNVLIHGGAGGVGTVAIQLLKAWNVGKVVVTCSEDSFELVSSLGAKPVDYRSASVKEELMEEGPFDVILDCVDSDLAKWSDNLMGIWRNCVHVSIVSPLLDDTDSYGVPFGLASTAAKYFTRSIQPARDGRWFSYAYFAPNQECLDFVSRMLETGRMKTVIDRTYRLEELPAAYDKVAEKRGRGKTVIDFEMKNENIEQDPGKRAGLKNIKESKEGK